MSIIVLSSFVKVIATVIHNVQMDWSALNVMVLLQSLDVLEPARKILTTVSNLH